MTNEENWLLKEKYHGEISQDFQADCRRLEAGEPLAYLIGYLPFLNCRIYLDSRPLIPRSETEYWVERAIRMQQDRHVDHPLKVLDLCAGSGAIGVAVAKALPSSHVTFAEIDEQHLPTINRNINENISTDANINRTEVVQSDLFSDLAGRFDLILSNPPYIDPALDRISNLVKVYEPALALYGGTSGMELIAKIIKAAPSFLYPGGQLWLEHEPEQMTLIQKLAQTHFNCSSQPDQYGTIRYTILSFLPPKIVAE